MGKKSFEFLSVALLLLLISSASWAASITGNVSYAGGKTGRIYLSVHHSDGGYTGVGVSIPSATSFTIDGVQPNRNYVVKAFMDTQSTNVQHANDPSGASSSFFVATTTGSAGTITLSQPNVAVEAPEIMVYRGTGCNAVMWNGPETNDGLVKANKYTVSWSTNGTTVAGSRDVVAGFNDFFIHNTTAYTHYRVTAVGATSASSPWRPVPAAAGTGSVTGTVSFAGGTPAGTLYVFLMDDSVTPPKFKATAVANPVSGGSYTISNVPAGSYSVIAFVDINGNGAYDLGDVGWLDNDDNFPAVTVTTTGVTAAAITLNNVDSAIGIATNHAKDGVSEWYNIDLTVQSMKKRVINAEILSGPQFTSAVDVALEGWQEFNTWVWVPARPTVGDTYQIKVTYSDTTTETVSRAVTAVLDGLPMPVAPVGNIPYNAKPTFSWAAPSPAPADYVYSIWLGQENGGWVWDVWAVPSSTTSLVYASQGEFDQATLTDGMTYRWNIEAKDRNNNKASSMASFTFSNAPYVSGFSPTFGQAGTVVTISGANFNTTPSLNSVLFNGVTATVNSATATSLTVTVPGGATSGPIQVTTSQGIGQSTTNFTIGAPTTFQGVVKTAPDATGAPIAGARVEKYDDSTVYTTTGADGSFSLNWVQSGYVSLRITKSGYVPTYTGLFDANKPFVDLRPYPSHLYTQAQLTTWGVTSGKGVIVGRTLNTGTAPFTPVSGVVVTAQSSSGPYYTVNYYDGASFGGSATYSNGLFFVKNVDTEWVNISASKAAWTFPYTGFNTYVGCVTEGGVFGSTQPPYIYSFSPTTGKAGTSVTIYGNNFSAVPAENSVTFNGVPATVTVATTISLTVTVPSAATSGQISVTTAGGTYTYGQIFTMINTIAATVANSSGGTVTSAPAGITCTNANSATAGCAADFDQGTPIGLTATASGGYLFKNWSGDCTGTTPTCSLTLTANKSVIATFEQLLYIKNGTNYYSLLQDAFDAAAQGNTIQAQAQTFTDLDLIFYRPAAQVKFKGGYDNSFNANSGYTTLDGKLSLRGGTLSVEKMKVK